MPAHRKPWSPHRQMPAPWPPEAAANRGGCRALVTAATAATALEDRQSQALGCHPQAAREKGDPRLPAPRNPRVQPLLPASCSRTTANPRACGGRGGRIVVTSDLRPDGARGSFRVRPEAPGPVVGPPAGPRGRPRLPVTWPPSRPRPDLFLFGPLLPAARGTGGNVAQVAPQRRPGAGPEAQNLGHFCHLAARP